MSNLLYAVKPAHTKHTEYYSILPHEDIEQVLRKRGVTYTSFYIVGSNCKASNTKGFGEPLSEIKADGSEA